MDATATVNANRDRKLYPEPFELPVPWERETAVEQVTPAEREALKARLLRNSAFADREDGQS